MRRRRSDLTFVRWRTAVFVRGLAELLREFRPPVGVPALVEDAADDLASRQGECIGQRARRVGSVLPGVPLAEVDQKMAVVVPGQAPCCRRVRKDCAQPYAEW